MDILRETGCTTPSAEEPVGEPSLVEYYRNICGEHDDWNEYRQNMREQQRVLVRVVPHTAGPDRKG